MSGEDSTSDFSSDNPFEEKNSEIDEIIQAAEIETGGKGKVKAVKVKKTKPGQFKISQALDPKDVIQTPFVIEDEFIAEQIWSRKTGEPPTFAVRVLVDNPKHGLKAGDVITMINGKPIRQMTVVSKKFGQKVTYVPLYDDVLRTGAVTVPDGIIETTWDEVYQQGVNLAMKIYDCSEDTLDSYKLLVAIVQSGWFLDKIKPKDGMAGMGMYAPIIAIRGASGSGKNRAMEALRMSAYRPFIDVMTNRVASLFRPMSKWKGTLLMDEADMNANGNEETGDISKYLDTRCTGSPYIRINPNDVGETQAFENFGITVVTQRRGWGDNALEDRTIGFYSSKSSKPIPTVELDEWVEEARIIQNKMLWLRLHYWDKIKIDKTFRFKNVENSRLTAALLPTMAVLSQISSNMTANIEKIVQDIETSKRQVKALSSDGQLITTLWDWLKNGFASQKGTGDINVWYVGKEKDSDGFIVPATPNDIVQELGNSFSSKRIRAMLWGLNLAPRNLPDRIWINNSGYRAVWFEPKKLDNLLSDFIISYQAGDIMKVLPVIAAIEQKNLESTEAVTTLD